MLLAGKNIAADALAESSCKNGRYNVPHDGDYREPHRLDEEDAVQGDRGDSDGKDLVQDQCACAFLARAILHGGEADRRVGAQRHDAVSCQDVVQTVERAVSAEAMQAIDAEDKGMEIWTI